MEDDVCGKKNDHSENNDKKKELGCLDDTSPVETEDDVCDKKTTTVKIMTRTNNLDALMTLPLLRRRMMCVIRKTTRVRITMR